MLSFSATFYFTVTILILAAAVTFVGLAIVGAGVRVATAILAIAGLLEAIRDRRP